MTKTERIEALEESNESLFEETTKLTNKLIALEKEVKALKEGKVDKETVWKKIDMGDGNYWYKCVLKEEAETPEIKTDLDKKKIELMDMILKNWTADSFNWSNHRGCMLYHCTLEYNLWSGDFERYLHLLRPLIEAAK